MKQTHHPFTKENEVKYDLIIKNLGTISTITISDKLYISNNSIFIQKPRTFISIIRWWYKYNRIETSKFLIKMFDDIDSLISILNFIIINQKPKRKKKRKRRRYNVIVEKKTRLIDLNNKATKGLQNLIITYSNDELFCNSINKILEKIYHQNKIKQL